VHKGSSSVSVSFQAEKANSHTSCRFTDTVEQSASRVKLRRPVDALPVGADAVAQSASHCSEGQFTHILLAHRCSSSVSVSFQAEKDSSRTNCRCTDTVVRSASLFKLRRPIHALAVRAQHSNSVNVLFQAEKASSRTNCRCTYVVE
jgi:hypothetical protein